MHYPPSKFSIPSNNIIINYISLLYTFFFLLTMGRPPCCDKANVKRGPWTKEEDAKILAHVASHGIGNWTLVPQKAGLNRCGKSCRLRWTNYLRPDLKHDGFTQEEEECILEMHRTIGSRWSLIARRLPGRTDNDVKNYWNTKLKKKLIKMGIDPITHKPFSQLFSEYGQISGSNVNPFVRNPIGLRVQENNARKIGHFVMNQEDFQEPCLFNEASYDGSDAMRFGCGLSCSFEGSREAFTGDEYILGGPEMEGRNEFSGVKGDGDGDGSGDSGKIVESCFYGSGDSGKNTFVEEILARDMEMRIQFPEFCSENYDY